MGPINNNNFNWERAFMKRLKGNNEGGGGSDKDHSSVSLGDAIVKLFQLEPTRYESNLFFGRPEYVIRTYEYEGIIDGSGVDPERFDTPIQIGDTTFNTYFVLEDESRWLSFNEFDYENYESSVRFFFAYKLSDLQSNIPSTESSYGHIYLGAVDLYPSEAPYFDGRNALAIYKYHDEFYVVDMNYG